METSTPEPSIARKPGGIGRLVLDGAMGTQLIARGASIDGCLEAENLHRPDRVGAIALEYVAAGADVLETNTFGANRWRLGAHDLERSLSAINHAAVRIARTATHAAGRRIWVAGCIGPSGLRFDVAPSALARAELVDGVRAQADALAEAGADLLVIETMRSWFELRAALEAARKTGLPVWALGAFDVDGKLEGGETAATVARWLEGEGAVGIGANCGEASGHTASAAEAMAVALGAARTVRVICVPSAGLPIEREGAWVWPESAADFGALARRLRASGVDGIGGCCGTTPAHVRAIAEATGD